MKTRSRIARAISSRLQILIICSLFVLSACSEENHSDKPVRLVITSNSVTWEGHLLSFEQPLSDWLKILGSNYVQGNKWESSVSFLDASRFVYPNLGIDIEVARNRKNGQSDWVETKNGWEMKDPFNRYVSVVRINLNPAYIVRNIGMNDETEKHPYNTMFADYAIDFYGAIVDSATSKEQILTYGSGIQQSTIFNRIDPTLENKNSPIQGYISFNAFYEQKAELSTSMQLTPSSELRRSNDIKYFGYAME